MFKRILALVLLLALALPMPLVRADIENVLVLTDTQGDAAMEAAEDYLRRMLAYTNALATYEDAWTDLDDVSAYTSIIVLMEEGRVMSEKTAWAIRKSDVKTFVIGAGGLMQLSDRVQRVPGSVVVRWDKDGVSTGDLLVPGDGLLLLTEKGESLGGQVYVDGDAYPLCQTVGDVTHMAYFDASSRELCDALATLIQIWQWPYENLPTAYGSYLVLDQVYPFYEPERLMAVTDMLEQEGVPYALSLMPIYDHAEYPAMKRFCEYLRYVQSRGAGMILRMPHAALASVDTQEMLRHMEIAYSAYSMYGVYPTALQAPECYLLCEKGIGLLSGFRTVFLFHSDEEIPGDKLHTNVARRDGHQIIAPAWEEMQSFTTSYAQAIYLDVNQPVETLREQVQRIKASRRVLKSLPQMENTLYLSDNYIVQNTDGLMINGVMADLSYTPFTYDENYEFDRGFVQYLTDQIETSNKLILIFVFIACTLFITFIFMSRWIMRRELVRGMRKQRQKVKRRKDAPAAQEVEQG